MIKRLIAILLAVLMLLSLVGCGAEASDEDKSVFCEVCGVYYPEELGAPVLDEAAAELVLQDISVAAEQITNVGDAIYYLQAANAASRVDDFVALIKDDYDEVGTILFMTSENYKYTCAYVRLGENYYPFDPVKLGISKILDSEKACGAATDIEALAQRMQADFPRQSGVDVYYSIMPLFYSDTASDNEADVHGVNETTGYNSVIDFYEIPFELGEPQYSEEEIKKMIADDLTLDETAQKLSTLADVVQYLYLKGYLSDGGDIGFDAYGREWKVNRSARVVYNNNAGNCGGGSNLLNYLLRGDYDEQGYVQESANPGGGGHIYNYFKQDDIYYFLDLTQVVFDNSYMKYNYSIYATADPYEFSEYYIGKNHKQNQADDLNYLRLQYMYPYDEDHLPVGMTTFMQALPKEIESCVTILYEEPQYAPIFVDAPSKDLWPAEAQ